MEWNTKQANKKETRVEFWGTNWIKLEQLCCDDSRKVLLGTRIMLTFLTAIVLLSIRTCKWIDKKKTDVKNEMAGPLK